MCKIEKYIKLSLVVAFMSFVSLWDCSPIFSACGSQNAGNIDNSGTISGVGSGSVGTQVEIGDKTTGGTQGPDQGDTPVQTSKPGTPTGTKGYNPLDDPNLGSRGKPMDTAKVDQISKEFQTGQPGGKESKGPTDQTGMQQPESYAQGGKSSSGTTTSGSTSSTSQPAYPPTSDGKTDPGKTASDYVKGLPPVKGSGSNKPPDNTAGTSGKTTSGSTQSGATTAGIDVKVVGNAPPGKCNIVNGQLVAVENYPVRIAGMTVTLTGPANSSATSSGGGVFSFKEIPAGNYVISVQQWNYGMTKQNFTAPSGKAVQITLKGSCPFLYVWTGEEYERENDIYSTARVSPHELLSNEGREIAGREGLFLQQVSLETISDHLKRERSYRDYYRIRKTLKADGGGDYRLKIKEQDSEHSLTDGVELWAVDQKPGVQTGVTRNGKLFFYRDLKPVESVSVIGGASINPLPLVKGGRGGFESIGLYDGEGVEIALPAEALRGGVLAITWQGFQEGVGVGHTTVSGRPHLALQRRDREGVWQTVDWIYPRDEREEAFLPLEEMGSGWDGGGKVRLVSASCDREKYHRIDRIGWARRSDEVPVAISLPLVSARKMGEDVRKELMKADGKSLALGPEEEVILSFQSKPLEQGLERTFIFVSEGFYVPVPYIRLAETR